MRKTAKIFDRKAGVDKNVRMVMFGHTNANGMDFRYEMKLMNQIC